jgi:F0F1-type ATP synthase delta subunit
MITYNEMYQAQQRYEDLMKESHRPRHNEVLSNQHLTRNLMKRLQAALSKPATEPKKELRKGFAGR